MKKYILFFCCLFSFATIMFGQELHVEWVEMASSIETNSTLHRQIASNRLAWSNENQVFTTDTLGEIIEVHEWFLEEGRTAIDYQLIGEEGADGWMVIGHRRSMDGDSSSAFTIRLDVEGDTLWQMDYNSDGYVIPRRIVQLDNGAYIAGGAIGDFRGGRGDMHFLGIAEDGRLIWQRRYDFMPADYQEMIWDIAPTADDGVIAVGRRMRPGTIIRLGWMLRLDENGDTLWTRILGEYNDELRTEYEFRQINRLEDGNFLVTGRYGDDRFQDDPRIWVLKIDEDSRIIWERGLTFPDTGVTFHPKPEELCELENGELLICGHRGLSDSPFVYLLGADGDSLSYMEWEPDSMRWFRSACTANSGGAFLMLEGHPPNRRDYSAFLFKLGLTNQAVNSPAENQPAQFKISPAFPNPFNSTTRLTYSINHPAEVVITIFNCNGRLVETISSSSHRSGEYQLLWDAQELPSGAYICRYAASGVEAYQVLNLLK